MATYVLDKDTTATKIKNEAKASVIEVITAALKAEYGEDNVFWVRTGKDKSMKNELAVIVGTADVKGEEKPICVTVTGTAKDFTERVGAKKTYETFDFEAARQTYEDYLDEKAEKEAEAAAKKAAKIEKDNAARAKKKAEAAAKAEEENEA